MEIRECGLLIPAGSLTAHRTQHRTGGMSLNYCPRTATSVRCFLSLLPCVAAVLSTAIHARGAVPRLIETSTCSMQISSLVRSYRGCSAADRRGGLGCDCFGSSLRDTISDGSFPTDDLFEDRRSRAVRMPYSLQTRSRVGIIVWITRPCLTSCQPVQGFALHKTPS